MFVVVSYDIVDNNMRNRMANLLLDYGRRVQKSVFECDLDEKNLAQMKNEALKYVDEEQDSLIIYRLCEGCVDKTESYGRQIVREDVMIV